MKSDGFLLKNVGFPLKNVGFAIQIGVAITRGRRVLLVGFLQDRRRAIFDRPRENSMAEMKLVNLR